MDEKTFNNNDLMKSDCPVCGGHKTLSITNKTDIFPTLEIF